MLKSALTLSLGLAGTAWADEPRPITVPAELGAVTSNPELSGIVWSPGLRRYLVVSDDSGLRDQGTNHEPIVLGLSAEGVFDKDPIVIKGVKKVNDLESICVGPDGTFFAATSHSPNREGRTSASRRLLLQLKPDKGALRVIASLDLTDIKGGASLLALLGLPSGPLDIEAITYHDEALYIGFKSPLSEKGEAVIARVDKPAQALRAGRISSHNLRRFLAVPLGVEEKGDRVFQGISDMTFLPDGSLVVTANAPKGGPKDHGGALWHLKKPVEKATPVLLRRFPGLKPEGVTLSASGRSLAVVFDCDSEIPKWIELPLPAGK